VAKRSRPKAKNVKRERSHLHPEPFFIVVVDRDNGIFNVIGPVEDDAPYVREVNRIQRKGRNVDLHNPGEFAARDDVVREVERTLGFAYADAPIVELRGA
jgi:hypothetical protein